MLCYGGIVSCFVAGVQILFLWDEKQGCTIKGIHMRTQNKEQVEGRVIDILHNQDKVLKESFTLFKGGSLAFLDAELVGEVTEILNTEITETSTKKAYGDNALKLSTNMGIHSEWEAQVSTDDIMRFGAMNIDLSRMHKIPFTTVVITAKKPGATQYENPSISFKPKVICLKDRDADKVLAEMDRKINAGEQANINELELIYLPLYGSVSGKSTLDLLDAAIKLTPQVIKDDKTKQQKLRDLLVLLAGSFINKNELNMILEANMRILEDNAAFKVFEDWGVKKGLEQTARNMLHNGEDYAKILLFTGLSADRIEELDKEIHAQA